MTSFFSNQQLNYLKPWFEDVSQARIESLGVSGGFSGAVIWRVSLAGSTLCLRRWPKEHPSLTGLLAIHGLLEHVCRAGYALSPVPMSTRFGETYFVGDDHLWELTPWMPGEATLATQPSTTKLVAAMTALADFHEAARDYQFQGRGIGEATSPGLHDRLNILNGLQQGGLQSLWQATRDQSPSDLQSLAFEMLEGIGHSLDRVLGYVREVAQVPLPMQWCLCDVKHDHLLFEDERVTALLDYGAVAVDSVAGDVARLLGSLVDDAPNSWQVGIDAYDTRRSLSPAERRAIVGFDRGGLLCSAANWVRWLFVEGRSFPQIHALHDQLVWLRNRLRSLAATSESASSTTLSGPTWDRSVQSSRSGGTPHQPETSPWMHT